MQRLKTVLCIVTTCLGLMHVAHADEWFNQPRGFSTYLESVVEIQNKGRNKDHVLLQGRLTSYLGRDNYEFTDLYGDRIEVELDDDANWSLVHRGQLITIAGKLDKNMFTVKVEAKRYAFFHDQDPHSINNLVSPEQAKLAEAVYEASTSQIVLANTATPNTTTPQQTNANLTLSPVQLVSNLPIYNVATPNVATVHFQLPTYAAIAANNPWLNLNFAIPNTTQTVPNANFSIEQAVVQLATNNAQPNETNNSADLVSPLPQAHVKVSRVFLDSTSPNLNAYADQATKSYPKSSQADEPALASNVSMPATTFAYSPSADIAHNNAISATYTEQDSMPYAQPQANQNAAYTELSATYTKQNLNVAQAQANQNTAYTAQNASYAEQNLNVAQPQAQFVAQNMIRVDNGLPVWRRANQSNIIQLSVGSTHRSTNSSYTTYPQVVTKDTASILQGATQVNALDNSQSSTMILPASNLSKFTLCIDQSESVTQPNSEQSTSTLNTLYPDAYDLPQTIDHNLWNTQDQLQSTNTEEK